MIELSPPPRGCYWIVPYSPNTGCADRVDILAAHRTRCQQSWKPVSWTCQLHPRWYQMPRLLSNRPQVLMLPAAASDSVLLHSLLHWQLFCQRAVQPLWTLWTALWAVQPLWARLPPHRSMQRPRLVNQSQDRFACRHRIWQPPTQRLAHWGFSTTCAHRPGRALPDVQVTLCTPARGGANLSS